MITRTCASIGLSAGIVRCVLTRDLSLTICGLHGIHSLSFFFLGDKDRRPHPNRNDASDFLFPVVLLVAQYEFDLVLGL